MRCSTRSFATRIRSSRSIASRFSCLDGDELIPKISRDIRGLDSERRYLSRSRERRSMTASRFCRTTRAKTRDSAGSRFSCSRSDPRSAARSSAVKTTSLGVLYLDNADSGHRFGEEDFKFCIAFAGIAAVAIENGQFAQRIQRELVTRNNFERFFTPQLAKQIAESQVSLRLGGDKRKVAVLFSDIRGFTALSETMRPEETASLLSEYFTQMVDCVFRHEGTLDKFIGDAVMAQWGAPIGGPDDADKALAAAIEMMHALEKLNASWRAAGRPRVQIGIGLNYGEAFAGNIGSNRRLEYTIIGDTVNTAKRVCSARRGWRNTYHRGVPPSASFVAYADAMPTDGSQEQEPASDRVSRRDHLMRDDGPPAGYVQFSVGTTRVVCAEHLADSVRTALAIRRCTTMRRANPMLEPLPAEGPRMRYRCPETPIASSFGTIDMADFSRR